MVNRGAKVIAYMNVSGGFAMFEKTAGYRPTVTSINNY